MRKWYRNLDSVGLLLTIMLLFFIIVYSGILPPQGEPEIVVKERQIFKTDTIYIDQLINLDRLDSIEEILYYEVIEDQLYLYTKKDSIRDEIERWNYIRSLDPEGWEQ
jgi:hypothetical protein